MSTLLQIRTAARDEISEPSPGFVSNAEMDRWINRAHYDLTDAAGIEATSSQSITTVDGTEVYALNSDAGIVEQVERVDASDANAFITLTPVALQDRQDGKGAPLGYYVLESSLYVVPKPDAAYTIRVWYVRVGATLVVDTDTPIIPTRFHDLLTLFAVSQAKRKGDDPAYATYLQDYVAGRSGMVEYLRKRGQGGRPRRVVDVYRDSGADGL